LPGAPIMSQWSKLRRSRNQWKCKAGQRGGDIRYLRKELGRIKQERDRLKKELKHAQACQRHSETRSQGLAVQHKVDLVLLALQLFLVARISFRAVCRVMSVLAETLGIKKVPCPQTVINWVTRLSLVRIQSASGLKGLPLNLAPSCSGLIWMIDMSIALGTGKILTVLALNAHHHQLAPEAPGFPNVHCIAVSVADSWTGETIAALLRRLVAVVGRPAAYLKDAGSDLHKAVRLLDEQGIGSLCIDDISHAIANLLKHCYGDQPLFETFVSACGRVSGKLKQTLLACLVPPKVHTKARFMNVHRLVTWADQLLKLSPPGGAAKGSMLSKLRACLDRLPACRTLIKRFRADAGPLLQCQKILKTKGLSYDTLIQCQPLIDTIPTAGIRHGFLAYLEGQLDTATALGLDEIGLPISSDQIESLFGLAKQHGAGEFKDADRIALRLPALCGIPTRAEAEQVLGISVASQNEITTSLNSLIKQRRQVLQSPDRLESLGSDQAQGHVVLIPDAKTRAKNQKKVILSGRYQEPHDPVLKCQNGQRAP
jgi:hypothetical protein